MEIITSARDLVVGDVLFIARKIVPRDGRDPFWWRAYWIVERVLNMTYVEVMLLKMHPDPEKDHRTFGLGDTPDEQIIQYLHPDEYPQGVQAMRIKHIQQGRIKLSG